MKAAMLQARMSAYACVCGCASARMSVSAFMSAPALVRMRVCIDICIHSQSRGYACVKSGPFRMCLCKYACTNTCLCVCINTCIHACIYISAYIEYV